MFTSVATEHKQSRALRIHRAALTDAIRSAFVESRFAEHPRPRYVNIHANGSVFIARTGLHVTQESISILAIRCFAPLEMPDNALPRHTPWTREEFAKWVAARNDQYLNPALEDLMRQGDRLKIRILLFD